MVAPLEKIPLDKEIFLSSTDIIATGANSTVYRIGRDRVAKLYDKEEYRENPSPILQYRDLTNRVAASLQKNPIRTVLDLGAESVPSVVSVVPVESIILTLSKLPVAYSRYVAGPTLLSVVIGKVGADDVRFLANETEWDYLLSIYRLLGSQILFRDRINAYFEGLSHSLDVEFGVRGINIQTLNVKLHPAETGLDFVVTDLAENVDHLVY